MWHEKVFIFMIVSFNFHLVSICIVHETTIVCPVLELFLYTFVSVWHVWLSNIVLFVSYMRVSLSHTLTFSYLEFALTTTRKKALKNWERLSVCMCVRHDWPETEVESSNCLHRFWMKQVYVVCLRCIVSCMNECRVEHENDQRNETNVKFISNVFSSSLAVDGDECVFTWALFK